VDGHSGMRLKLTAVRHSSAELATDRCSQTRPTYEVDVKEVLRPIIVLDPQARVWWLHRHAADPGDRIGGQAWVQDDTTLHVLTIGSPLTEFVRCDMSSPIPPC
jgi:hypothetical protein